MDHKSDLIDLYLSFLTGSIKSLYIIYITIFVVIAFSAYAVELIFEIPHQEYPIDGIYTILILIGFIFHTRFLFNLKIKKFQDIVRRNTPLETPIIEEIDT